MSAAQDQIVAAVERAAKRKLDFVGYRPVNGAPTYPDGSLMLHIEFASRSKPSAPDTIEQTKPICGIHAEAIRHNQGSLI